MSPKSSLEPEKDARLPHDRQDGWTNHQLERIYELEEALSEMEGFSRSVSHDLRAPLRAILGFSRIIMEDHGHSLEESAKEHLARVIKSAEKMELLIDGLLKLAGLSQMKLSLESVDLGEMAKEILHELEESFPDRKVNLTLGRNLVATGDSLLLRSLLMNVLSNAWKFTKNRVDARIEFDVETHASERVYFIRDNGAGFEQKCADRLFGAFQRLHSSDQFEGMGIGLATVRRIIDRHGGRVWAEGRVDHGATFFFTLGKAIEG